MTGLILGRFIPPHNGHLQLINTALAQCTRVYLVICSLKTDAIPAGSRIYWIKQLFAQEIAISSLVLIHIDKELPAAQRNRPHAPEIWAGAITEHIPGHIDAVFSSEPYGEELSHALGAQCIQFDTNRPHVPVSASNILADPQHHWEHVPINVRPYFAKTVYSRCPNMCYTTFIHVPSSPLAVHISEILSIPEYNESSPKSWAFVSSLDIPKLLELSSSIGAGIISTLLSTENIRTTKCLPFSTEETRSKQEPLSLTASIEQSKIYLTMITNHILTVLRDVYSIHISVPNYPLDE